MADDEERGGNSLLAALAHPSVVNPLAAYQGAAQTANSIWTNREWQAKQAVGEAFQNSINPDGTPNQTKLLQNLQAAGGRAALAAQPSAQLGQNLDNSTFDTHMKRLTGMNAAAMALTAQYPNGVPQDAINAEIDRVGPQYGLSPQEMEQAKRSFGADPVSNSRTIIRNGISNLSAQDALHASRPGATTIDDGQGVSGAQVGSTASDQPGAVTPVGPKTPTGFPTHAAGSELVDVSDAAGNHYKVPRSSLPGFAGPASPLGTGRPPPGLRNPNAPQTAAPPPDATSGTPAPAPGAPAAPLGVPPGATLSGVSPATDVENKGAAEHAVAARDMANSYQQRIQPIEGALSALAGADTGKGGETLNTIRAYTQDVAPAFIQRMLPNWATDKEARVQYEEANKYLTSAAINAPGGSRSNAGQEAASAATPSVHISNAAAQLVARAALAQQRLTQAGTLAFNQSGQPAANYDRFMNTWNTQADPRAFIADKMTGPERAEMVKGMGGTGSAAYQKFKQSYRDAVTSGVVASHDAR